jgi:hypothetical protein
MTRQRTGRGVAELLYQAWRPTAETSSCSTLDLIPLSSLLVTSGSAGLAWEVLKRTHSALQVAALGEHARWQRIANVAHERGLADAFVTLRAAGVEPLLFKGWAVGRLYPQPGMRAYGDADLCVQPQDAGRAGERLADARPRYPPIDLHVALPRRYGISMESLFARSLTVPLGDVAIRIPAAADHLRLLCIHALRHGLDRPISLCDVALFVEREGQALDWNSILVTPRQAAWVRCAVLLAHELLGADISRTPWASDRRPLPRWLVPAVITAWSREGPRSRQWALSVALEVRGLRVLPHELRRRWRNPIEATVEVSGPFNGLPRLPWQLAAYLGRAVRLVRD